jgi:anthranilate phosphoribosyltransferase
MAERIIGALAALGKSRALVYYGHDGLDELTTTTTSTVYELVDGEIRSFELDPKALGFAWADAADLAGGDAATNAAIVHRVMGGDRGAIRDIVVLNAAAALVVADLASDMTAGVELAAEVIDDGRAAGALDRFVGISQTAAADLEIVS